METKAAKRNTSDPTHAFSVYRVADRDSAVQALVDAGFALQKMAEGHDDLALYLHRMPNHKPKWAKVFKSLISLDPSNHVDPYLQVIVRAVLFISIGEVCYAVCGGLGASQSIDRFIEDEFGLAIAARLLPSDRIKSVLKSFIGALADQQEVHFAECQSFFSPDISGWDSFVKRLVGELKPAELQQHLGIQTKEPLVQMRAGDSIRICKTLNAVELLSLIKEIDSIYNKPAAFEIHGSFVEVNDSTGILESLLVQSITEEYQAFQHAQECYVPSRIGISYKDMRKLFDAASFTVKIGRARKQTSSLNVGTIFSILSANKISEFKSEYISDIKISAEDENGTSVINSSPLIKLLSGDVTSSGERYYIRNGKWLNLKQRYCDYLDVEISTAQDDCQKFLGNSTYHDWPLSGTDLVKEDTYLDVLPDSTVKIHPSTIEVRRYDKYEPCDILDLRGDKPRLVFVKRGAGADIRVLAGQAFEVCKFLANEERLGTSKELSDFKDMLIRKAHDDRLSLEPSSICTNNLQIVFLFADHRADRQGTPLNEVLSMTAKISLIHHIREIRRLGIGDVGICFVGRASER